jgi:hypothetical protein
VAPILSWSLAWIGHGHFASNGKVTSFCFVEGRSLWLADLVLAPFESEHRHCHEMAVVVTLVDVLVAAVLVLLPLVSIGRSPRTGVAGFGAGCRLTLWLHGRDYRSESLKPREALRLKR